MFICGFLSACSDTPKTSDQDIKQVDYPQLIAMLQNQKPEDTGFFDFLQQKKAGPTVLLDPRIERRFNEGHLPGAVNIPLPKLVADDANLANAQNIVVYGTGWTDYLSPAAAKRLMAMGYKNVYDFRGGIELWKAQGGRVEVTTPTTVPLSRPSDSSEAVACHGSR